LSFATLGADCGSPAEDGEPKNSATMAEMSASVELI